MMEYLIKELVLRANLFAAGVVLAASLFLYLLRPKLAYPPGPLGWPIIGNLLDYPSEYEWLYWAKYKDRYGPVSSTTVLRKRILILNTLEPCIELLDKRSANFSNRPRAPFAGEIVGWDKQLVMSPYGDHFRAMRKLAHKHFGTKAAVLIYHESQEIEARRLVAKLHAQGTEVTNLYKLLRSAIGSILMRMSHGYIPKEDGDPLITLNETAVGEFYEANKPGVWLVDSFPILKHIPAWFPGGGFQRIGQKFRKTNVDQTEIAYKFVLDELENKRALPSFTSAALESDSMSPDEQHALKYIAAALYGGGLDPVLATASTFFLAMLMFPEVQMKAQEEIDRVIGSSRLPAVKDRERLPYLAAVHKEVCRWHTVLPLGIPRCPVESDVYQGYTIPKESLVLSNYWQIAHDPSNYDAPMDFNPERFLGETKAIDPSKYIFGFGRRRCPGMEVTGDTLFIIMATVLSVFKLRNWKDADGKENPPKAEFLPGIVTHPKMFHFIAEPRSFEAQQLLEVLQSELADKLEPSQLRA